MGKSPEARKRLTSLAGLAISEKAGIDMMGIALRVSYTPPGPEEFTGEFDMEDIDSNFGCAAGVSRVVKESGAPEIGNG